jgi:four helix bundle protein
MQELEETAYWLELLERTRFCGRDQLEALTNEADQLMAIFVTIVRKTKAGMSVADSREERVRVSCS